MGPSVVGAVRAGGDGRDTPGNHNATFSHISLIFFSLI